MSSAPTGSSSLASGTSRKAIAEQPPELELGPFVRGVAHEVANPLNAVLMNVGLAKMLYERGDMARVGEVLERLAGDCGRFEKMLRGLQRFGGGLREPQRDIVPAAQIVERAIEMVPQLKDAALHVEAEAASVDVDARAVERALAGILLNAIEAGAANVVVRAQRSGGNVAITVVDDGEGIPAESLGKVADPFYSTRHSLGNAGLGLTLASEVLRLNGGTLAVAANEPRGVRVSLQLPLAENAANR
jgi:signal transduction histidine kinase